MTKDSIEQIISERLDKLFGEDDDREKVPQSAEEPLLSDIFPLRRAAEELERRVESPAVERLTSAIRSLDKKRGKEPLFLPLLRMLYLLSGQLNPDRPELNKSYLQSIRSCIECMEFIEAGQSLPLDEKRKRVQKEIDSFKVLRETIINPKPPAKPQGEAPPRITADSGHSTAGTMGKETVAAKPTPAPSSRKDAAEKVPSQKEPKHGAADSLPTTPAYLEQKALADEVSSIKAGMDEMAETFKARSGADDEFRKLLADLGTRIGTLSSQQTAIRSIVEKAVERAAPKEEPPPHKKIEIEDIRACVVEVLEERLGKDMEALGGIPADFRNLSEAFSNALTRIEKLFHGVYGEIEYLQESLDLIRSEIHSLEVPVILTVAQEEVPLREEEGDSGVPLDKEEPEHSTEKPEEAVSEPEDVQEEVPLREEEGGSGVPLDKEEPEHSTEKPEEAVSEPEDIQEEVPLREEEGGSGFPLGKKEPAAPNEKEPDEKGLSAEGINSKTLPDRAGLLTGNYFLFAVGGKRYAVDERYVIKVSNAGADLVSKAKTRGGLTLSDSKTGLFSIKRGIEPPWRFMTSREIKRDLFRLVSKGVLGVPSETEARGVLYLGLGFGNERIMLFTDHPAERTNLGNEEDARISETSGHGPFARSVSINRPGEPDESYSVISPEELV